MLRIHMVFDAFRRPPRSVTWRLATAPCYPTSLMATLRTEIPINETVRASLV